MAKAKFDLKSIEIPTVAQKPLYAGVGAGDLAYTAVREYVADVQKRITEVQKSVTDFDAKKARKQAADAAAARRAAVETRVNDLQKDALEIPTRVQTLVNDNVAVATATYTDLAKRGEALVRGTKLPSSVSAEVKVNPTHPGAKKANTSATAGTTKKSATKKAPATKSTPAKKAAAKKA
jgi:hypothetical protein